MLKYTSMKCGSFAKRKEKNSRRKISVARKTLVCYTWISQSLTSQNKGSTINVSFCYSHSVSSLFSIAPFHNISLAFRSWLKLALFPYLTSFFFFRIPAVEFFRKTSFSLEQFSLRFCTSLAFYLPLSLRQLLFYFYPSFLLNSSLLLLLRTLSSSFVPTNRSSRLTFLLLLCVTQCLTRPSQNAFLRTYSKVHSIMPLRSHLCENVILRCTTFERAR